MISGPEQAARSGTTKQLVIILHGWGADGVNLIDLAKPWGIAMPDAHFCAPNAPHICEANPMGFQWFSLMDRSPAQMLAGVQDAAKYVNEFIDAKLKELSNMDTRSEPEGEPALSASEQIAKAGELAAPCASQQASTGALKKASPLNPPASGGTIKIALVGFSQGTMTALHSGLRRNDVACILGYSGALLDTKEMIQNIIPPACGGEEAPKASEGGETTNNKIASPLNPPASGGTLPPICLIHGEEDDVVPFASMAHAEEILNACGINIQTHARPNLPHSIDMEGVEIGGKFLLEQLG